MQLLNALLIQPITHAQYGVLMHLKPKLCFDAYEDGNISENATEPKTEDICDTDLRRSRFNDSVFC